MLSRSLYSFAMLGLMASTANAQLYLIKDEQRPAVQQGDVLVTPAKAPAPVVAQRGPAAGLPIPQPVLAAPPTPQPVPPLSATPTPSASPVVVTKPAQTTRPQTPAPVNPPLVPGKVIPPSKAPPVVDYSRKVDLERFVRLLAPQAWVVRMDDDMKGMSTSMGRGADWQEVLKAVDAGDTRFALAFNEVEKAIGIATTRAVAEKIARRDPVFGLYRLNTSDDLPTQLSAWGKKAGVNFIWDVTDGATIVFDTPQTFYGRLLPIEGESMEDSVLGQLLMSLEDNNQIALKALISDTDNDIVIRRAGVTRKAQK